MVYLRKENDREGETVATLKDVAREAGLTVGTVSRVLNNRGYISGQTREKVYDVMKRLNYQPNEMARSLSKQKSNTIGVIVPHIVHPFFSKVISNLEQAAYNSQYRILLFNSKEKEEKEEEYIEACKSNRVAGVILCSGSFSTEKFKNLGFPLITIERFLDAGTAGIECDNYSGGVLAAEHLISLGCRHLLDFGGIEKEDMPADDRERAFAETCREHGVDCVVAKGRSDQYYAMEYHDYIEQALLAHPETDGVFASSDVIAAQVIQICAKLGISIPEKLKLVGFDDVNIASLTTPRITTIRQPIKEMADTSIDLIVKSSQGELVPSRTVLPVRLVKRETA